MMTIDEAIRARQSVRSFKSTPVPDEMIFQMLEAARLAPSSSNIQPWRFVVVTDPTEKKEIRRLSHYQPFLENTGVIFVVCADVVSYSPDEYIKRRQEAIASGSLAPNSINDPYFLARLKDLRARMEPSANFTLISANTYIAAEHIVLTATALGLGSCWIGAIYDRDGIKKLLGIPEKLHLLVLIAVGYQDCKTPARPHFPMEKILLRPFPPK